MVASISAPVSAMPAFASWKKPASANEYTAHKKSAAFYCAERMSAGCPRMRRGGGGGSYAARSLFASGAMAAKRGNGIGNGINVRRALETRQFNKNSLLVGSRTVMNLGSACSLILQPPCDPDACASCGEPVTLCINDKPFFCNYYIDPVGDLFGRSQCGELNYTHYMRPLCSMAAAQK